MILVPSSHSLSQIDFERESMFWHVLCQSTEPVTDRNAPGERSNSLLQWGAATSGVEPRSPLSTRPLVQGDTRCREQRTARDRRAFPCIHDGATSRKSLVEECCDPRCHRPNATRGLRESGLWTIAARMAKLWETRIGESGVVSQNGPRTSPEVPILVPFRCLRPGSFALGPGCSAWALRKGTVP